MRIFCAWCAGLLVGFAGGLAVGGVFASLGLEVLGTALGIVCAIALCGWVFGRVAREPWIPL